MRGFALLSGSAFTFCLVGCSDQSISTPTDAVSGPSLTAPVPGSLRLGRVETVIDLKPLIDLPEGIAIDQSGTIFISNRRLKGDLRVSEVLQITPDNRISVLVTLDPAVPNGAAGVTGLAVGSHGEVYAALASSHPETHGVWRIGRGGSAERLAGSQQIAFPNALAFDARGNLYVTDTQGGAVWRFPPQGEGNLWIRHELLAPGAFGLGANGIAFVPPNQLFVANTDRALIARIPIEPGGRPGKPKVAAKSFELLTIDGLAADAHGNLHAVIALSEVLGIAPLVRVNPETGEIKSESAEVGRFDFPTSLTFGAGTRDPRSIYVVNSGLFPEGRPDAAPGVVRVGLPSPGLSVR